MEALAASRVNILTAYLGFMVAPLVIVSRRMP